MAVRRTQILTWPTPPEFSSDIWIKYCNTCVSICRAIAKSKNTFWIGRDFFSIHTLKPMPVSKPELLILNDHVSPNLSQTPAIYRKNTTNRCANAMDRKEFDAILQSAPEVHSGTDEGRVLLASERVSANNSTLTRRIRRPPHLHPWHYQKPPAHYFPSEWIKSTITFGKCC